MPPAGSAHCSDGNARARRATCSPSAAERSCAGRETYLASRAKERSCAGAATRPCRDDAKRASLGLLAERRLRRECRSRSGHGDHLIELERVVLPVDLLVGEVSPRARAARVEPGAVPRERQRAIFDAERPHVARIEREADAEGRRELRLRGELERVGIRARELMEGAARPRALESRRSRGRPRRRSPRPRRSG